MSPLQLIWVDISSAGGETAAGGGDAGLEVELRAVVVEAVGGVGGGGGGGAGGWRFAGETGWVESPAGKGASAARRLVLGVRYRVRLASPRDRARLVAALRMTLSQGGGGACGTGAWAWAV